MRLSEDRISHLAHLLCEVPAKKGMIQVADAGRILQQTKEVLFAFCKIEDEIDDIVRKKIASYSRNIQEGSPEWDVMYRKHYEEELNKKF